MFIRFICLQYAVTFSLLLLNNFVPVAILQFLLQHYEQQYILQYR